MMTTLLQKTIQPYPKAVRYSLLASLLLLVGCNAGDGSGTAITSVSLPTDTALDLYCEDVGINTNTCVLDDPANPYAHSLVNDTTKWVLHNASPSAKSRFYLWATALAKSTTGENQYYTALALHELYTEGGSVPSTNARAQAKKAYRSLLDNFYSSLTYYTAGSQLDLIPDTDFTYSDFGSGTSGSGWEGGHTGDTDFTPVWYLPPGDGWGASTAALGFSGFTAGTPQKYNNLVFKVKGLPTNQVWVKLVDSNLANDGDELSFDSAAYATDIAGTTAWQEFTIPLTAANFPNLTNASVYNGLLIHTGWGNGGTFLLTDVAFTGDATGNGLQGDVDNNGFIYLYRSGTQQYSLELKNLVGRNLYDPSSINNLQLYGTQVAATTALSEWGYTYDSGSQTLSKTQ